jgi:hypothetical protein
MQMTAPKYVKAGENEQGRKISKPPPSIALNERNGAGSARVKVVNPYLRQLIWRHFLTIDFDRHLERASPLFG